MSAALLIILVLARCSYVCSVPHGGDRSDPVGPAATSPLLVQHASSSCSFEGDGDGGVWRMRQAVCSLSPEPLLLEAVVTDQGETPPVVVGGAAAGGEEAVGRQAAAASVGTIVWRGAGINSSLVQVKPTREMHWQGWRIPDRQPHFRPYLRGGC